MRIPQLDGLRGVAVLLVFCVHIFPVQLPGSFIGVDIFFVLSGFLITSLLLIEQRESGGICLRAFYWRRVLRLVPALLVMLTLYVAFLPAIFGRDHLIAAASSLYAMNWVLAFKLGPAGFLAHTWSLAIEEQFYLLWPMALILLLRWGSSRSLTPILIGSIIAVIVWRLCLQHLGAPVLDRLKCGLDTRADTLLIGCLLACSPRFSQTVGRAWIFAVFFLVAEALFLSEGSPLSPWLFTFTAIAAASIISALMSPTTSVLQQALRIKPIVKLGEISYGFYLWHFVIIYLLQAETHLRPFIVGACALVLTIAVSWLSFRFIEKPILRLGRNHYTVLKSRGSMEPVLR